jgi:hypothetical protein
VCRPGLVSLGEAWQVRCAYIRDGAVKGGLGRRALCSEEAVHGGVVLLLQDTVKDSGCAEHGEWLLYCCMESVVWGRVLRTQ